MFDPYASSGEPPTDASNNYSASAQTVESSGSQSHQEASNLSLSSGSSRSLSVLQEPDSGYEASPSSIADNQRFFGDASRQETRQPSSDDEYDIVECSSQILFSDSDSELEDYDTCRDCSSSPVSCSCFRTDSSNATAISNCDSSDLSFSARPSSQPIQIPNLPSCRITSNRIVVSSPVDICSTSGCRSQPTDFSSRLRVDFEHSINLSWPSTGSPLRRFALSRSSPSNRDIHMNICRNNHPVRSRRQIIDSDASSYGSSDDEGPEDVFNMPSGEASSYPTMMTMSTVPLPDVVLESTDTGRRSRSLSINLPPDREQVINNIGQRLRRMSDLFVQRRELRMAVMRARSRTTSDCDDHLHRNGLS